MITKNDYKAVKEQLDILLNINLSFKNVIQRIEAFFPEKQLGEKTNDNKEKDLWGNPITKDGEEAWISTKKFEIETRICTASTLSKLFSKDRCFFECCAKRIKNKIFIQKNKVVEYLELHSQGRIYNSVIKYKKYLEGKNEGLSM